MAEHGDTLVIRVDADGRMGAGHVMRCLALAHAWAGHGGRVLFCGRVESPSLQKRLLAEGFNMVEPGPQPGDTVTLLTERGLAGCWVCLDGYHFGPQWQEELGAAGFKIVCVDDGAKLPHYVAHVILSPEHDASLMVYNAPSLSVILAGPRYRLLRRCFTESHRLRLGTGERTVVLVTFGGADERNATRAALSGLDAALGKNDMVLVILGPLNPHRVSVEQALAEVSYGHELYQNVVDMAALYERADLAVSAAGGSAWEMAAVGLPTVLVPVASNQLPGANYLVRFGAAVLTSGPEFLETPDFPALVRGVLDNQERLTALSASGPQICDGLGSQRVCRVLAALSGDEGTDRPDYVVRLANQGDMEQVFRLANEPVVRANSFSPEPINLTEHSRWFAAKLASPETIFFVMDFEGVVAALVRYDRFGDIAEIDLAVHPAFRGRGLGTKLLRASAQNAMVRLGVKQLRAVVLEENLVSRRCFKRADFCEAAQEQVMGKSCAVFVKEA